MHPAQLFCVLVFTFALGFVVVINEAIRSQIVTRIYGGQRVSWREFRSALDWFGRDGKWSLHYRYYPDSRLRLWFAVSLVIMVVAFAFGGFLQAQGIR